MNRRYGSFQVLAAAALWGTTGPVEVLASLHVAPAAVGAVRILTGGLVLLVWSLARRPLGSASPLSRALSRRHWPPLLAASCATGVFQAAYFTSVSRTGAALATAIVFGVAPVATGLAARVTDRSPLGSGWAASTACAIAGCTLLLLPDHAGRADVIGVVLAIVAAACYAVYTVSAKRLADDGAPMTATVSITLMTGGLMLTPWLITAGPGLFTGRALLTVAWLGPVTTAVAYMLFVQGLRTVSAATAGTLSLAEPLVAAAAGIGLLHEHMTVPAVIGCGLLAVGLAFAALRRPRGPGDLGRQGNRRHVRQLVFDHSVMHLDDADLAPVGLGRSPLVASTGRAIPVRTQGQGSGEPGQCCAAGRRCDQPSGDPRQVAPR
jgi:drug/metabolite transporter, DME family